MKNMADIFKNDNYEEEDRSIEVKIKKLEISSERVEELRKINCKDLPNIDYADKEMVVEDIELDKLVGWNRFDNGKNWIENLANLHKFINFDRYKGKEEFEIFINMQSDDLPSVIEYQNEYYVDGNGKHRAKCVGVTKIPAAVIKTGL